MNRSRWLQAGFVFVAALLLVLWRGQRTAPTVTSGTDAALLAPGSAPASTPADGGARPRAASVQPAAPSVVATPVPVVAVRPAPPSPVAQFNSWTEKYLAAAPAEKAALLAEGEALAKARREQMLGLIKTSPEQALAEALPYRLRKGLPDSITAQLEERVSGRGNFTAYYATPLPDQAVKAPSVWRQAVIQGRTYDVFTYGRRLQQRSANGLSLQGIALATTVGGPAAEPRALALAVSPVRVLEPAEAADFMAAGKIQPDAICSVSGQASSVAGQQTLADFGGDIVSFCKPNHAADLNQSLSGLWGDAGGGGGALPVGASTQGVKSLLFIRLRFPDELIEPITEDAAYQVMDQVNNFFVENSYNTLSITPTVTPLLTLPRTKTQYDSPPPTGGALFGPGVNIIYNDALAVAAAAGYDSANYNLNCIIFTKVPTFNFGGLAGGNRVWLQGSGAGLIAHEYGHIFGLAHANFWNTKGAPIPGGTIDPDGRIGHDSIIGAGLDVEYGDPFDTMGGGGGTGDVFDDAAGLSQFNAVHKHRLHWLPEAAVQTVTTNATNRVYAFDATSLEPGKIHALKIRKDYERDYWISHRQKLTQNPWMMNGVQLHWNGWSQTQGGSSELLDTTPGSRLGLADSALVIGRTFTDPGLQLYITPIAKGGISPHPWIDVVVNFGPFPTNVPPTVSISASAQTVGTNGLVTLTATAVDANGDALAHSWDFGDDTFGINGPVVTKAWSTNAEYVVRCVVSDMKGGEASAYQVIRVGSPPTRRIYGRVTDPIGNPVQGVRIHNGLDAAGYRLTYTDSDGYYTLVNLISGSYTCEGFLYGYKTAPDNFINPVVIAGADPVEVNFVATALPVVGITAVTNAAEGGSPGQFIVSRNGSISEPLTVLFHTSGKAVGLNPFFPFFSYDYESVTNQMIQGNAVGATNLFYYVVIPAGAYSTNITVIPFDDGAFEGSEDVVIDLELQTQVFRDSSYLTPTNTLVIVSNQFNIPGWEVITVNGQAITFQTYPDYVLGPSSTARVMIQDNEPVTLPFVFIQASESVAMESGNDYAEFTISRFGSWDNALTINFTVSGTVFSGADYVALPPTVTIPAGQGSVILPVKAINDLFVEGTETVILTLTPDAAYLGNGSATVYIVDDDLPLITVSATDATALESGGTGTFTVTRTGNLAQDLLVNYLVFGTALSALDYNVQFGSVIIPAGASSTTVTVNPKQDAVLEGAETVSIFISDSETYNIGSPNSAIVTILDDELPTINIASTTPGAVEGGASALFTLTRTGPTNNDVLVFFQVAGTAIHQADYAGIGNSVLIPSGASTGFITIQAISDQFRESAENVLVLLSNSPSYNLGNSIRAEAIIAANGGDTNRPAVGFTLKNSSGLESKFLVILGVAISAPPVTNTIVQYRVTGGTASNGVDYTLLGTGMLLWTNGGPTIQDIKLNVVNDANLEPNETIIVTLFDPDLVLTNVTSVTNVTPTTTNIVYTTNTIQVPTNAFLDVVKSHTYTIMDDDLSEVSIVAAEPDARENGPKNGLFVINRVGSTNNALTVNFFVTGTASSRTDYVPLGNSVIIPAGSNYVNLYVIPVDDQVEEFTETVNVELYSAPGAHLGSSSFATVCITDNDGTIQFTLASYQVNEYESNAVINVQRTGDSNLTVTVDYLIKNGTATNGLDYFTTNGTLTFPPGVVNQRFTIAITNDLLVEATETVSLVLTNPTGGVPLGGQNVATLNILDDDIAFEFAAPVFRANENGTNAYVTVNRLGVFTNAVFVSFSTTNGTATNSLDYIGTNLLLNFAAGQTNFIVPIRILDDILFEGDETVNLRLSGPAPGTTLAPSNTAALVIVDDECALQFTVQTNLVNEYAGLVSVVVQRVGGTVNPVSVNYATITGTASNIFDFAAVAGVLNFTGDQIVVTTNGSGTNQFIPGESVHTINITIFDDQIGEGNETLSVILSNPVGPVVGALPGSTIFGTNTNTVVLILDNELPGSVDYEFAIGSGANSNVLALALQSDQKIVMAGEFTVVQGVSFSRIARLQPSGILDTGFNPGAGANSNVLAVASQSDHKVLIGGAFSTVDGTNRTRIARLNANGNLDLSFNPGQGANGLVRAIVVQTNGQVVIAGDFTQVNGTNRTRLARLNADGTLDPGYAPVFLNPVSTLALDAEGKIVAGGAFTTVNGTGRSFVARLNTNGTLDLTFSPSNGPNGPVNSVAIQNDGKILIGGAFTSVSGTNFANLARLTASGVVDLTFTPGTGPNGPVNAVAVHPGGKILIGGAFDNFNGTSRNNFARLKPNGGLDTIFNPGSGANAPVRALVVQPDTALVIGGDFTVVNTLPKNHLARIHGDEKSNIIGVEFGQLVFTVSETNGPAVITLVRTGNTNLPFTIGFTTTGQTATGGAAPGPGVDYFVTNGTVSFAAGQMSATIYIPIYDDLLVEGDETVRLNLTNAAVNIDQSGLIEATLVIYDNERFVQFNPTSYAVFEGATNFGVTVTRIGGLSGTATVLLNTSNGTASAGTDYIGLTNYLVTFLDGVSNQTVLLPINTDTNLESSETVLITLSNPNGAILGTPSTVTVTIFDQSLAPVPPTVPGGLDLTFNPGDGADNFVRSLAIYPDGKILIGGAFVTFAGTNRGHVARLNTNGVLDLAFDPGAGANDFVSSVAVAADGKALIGGAFTDVNVLPRNRAAYLKTNGTVDGSLGLSAGLNSAINAVAPYPGGKSIVGGGFTVPIPGVARLRADGLLDASFNPGTGANGQVHAVFVQSNGQVVIGGSFTMVDGVARSRMARLNADGTVDGAFVPGVIPSGAVYSVIVQTDGKVVIAGEFSSVNGTNRVRVARLHANGSLDLSFDPGTGPNATVFSVAVQGNHKVILGGDFTTVAGTSRNRYARLRSDGSLDTAFSPGTGADRTVYAVALQPDGRVVIGGDFNTVNGQIRNGVARLFGDTEIRIASLVRNGGQVSLTVSSPGGLQCVLQTSSDLVNWTSLSTNWTTGVDLLLIDSTPGAAGAAQRFYRVRTP